MSDARELWPRQPNSALQVSVRPRWSETAVANMTGKYGTFGHDGGTQRRSQAPEGPVEAPGRQPAPSLLARTKPGAERVELLFGPPHLRAPTALALLLCRIDDDRATRLGLRISLT